MGEKTRKFCRDVILITAVALIGILLIKKLFFLALPVGAGYLFSEAARGSFRKLKPLSPGAKRALIILILMILFALLLLATVLLTEKALKGVKDLGDGLEQTVSRVSAWLQDSAGRMGKWLSGILHRDVESRVTDLIPSLLSEGAKKIASRLPEWVGKIAAGVPLLVASLILFLFSGYYFSCEWERAQRLFHRLCPAEKKAGVLRRKAGFLRALKKLLRAYGILFLITFGELLIGFWILKVPGSVGKAALVALVDALPVFGCGTVLIPWGVVLLLQKKTAEGIGILLLYLAIFVIRQFIEPKIVGKSIGLHPIVSLILALGGLALFGVWGMILLPLAAACLAGEEISA